MPDRLESPLRTAARRAIPEPVLLARRIVRVRLAFLREELASPVRFASPSLVARGYLSDRRWQYPSSPSRSEGYLSDTQYRRVVAKINPLPVQHAFNDKSTFARSLIDHGLAEFAPRPLATVLDGRLTTLAESDGPVVLKPVGGSSGKGVAVFASMAEAVAACPRTGDFLLQEKIVGHPYSVEIFPDSLNTLRIFAIRDEHGAPPRVTVAVQRIGSAETAPLDSFSAGGMVARVDLTTGELSYAVGRVVRRARPTYDHHPDTGARITGRRVPLLDDALELVLRAMRVYPGALHIGWDIAVSDRGPIIIEGNARRPAIRSVQAHGPFANDPSCRAFYQRWGLLPT